MSENNVARVVGKVDEKSAARIRLSEKRRAAKRVRAHWRTTLGESLQKNRSKEKSRG
jgi:hypothetical protein